MASDSPGDGSVSVDLPESLRRWLADKAAEEGRSREDLLLQLLSVYRKVDGLEEGEVALPPGMSPDDGLPAELEAAVEQRVDERVERRLAEMVDQRVEDRVGELVEEPHDAVDAETLEARVDDAESRFTDLLEDVRDRVLQVKRETDAKAQADHDHPELAATAADLGAALEDAREELAGIDDDIEALETRVDSGFENYEEVLEYLADNVDRVSARQTTLAKALVETREALRSLEGRDAARAAAESLQRQANTHDVRTADCEACGTTVDVGLLSRPECPHCAETFVDLEPASSYFGADSLAVGDLPALVAGDDPEDGFEYGVTAIAEDDGDGTSSGSADDQSSPDNGADGASEGGG